MNEDEIYISYRLHLKRPEHARINEYFKKNLGRKNKSEFITKAILYYIEHEGILENETVVSNQIKKIATEAAREECIRMFGIYAGVEKIGVGRVFSNLPRAEP